MTKANYGNCYKACKTLFVVFVLVVMVSCNFIITQAATFTPRLSAPAADSPYYSNGAYNPFVSAVGTLSNVPNCTTYAWGRAYEILGARPPLPTGNAKDWYGAASNKGPTPKLGAVACWNGGTWGHVAVVEEINGNDLTLSESSYSPSIYWQPSYKNATNMGAGFQGYIYIGEFTNHNPVVYFDGVSAGSGKVTVWGWAYDPDDLTRSIDVHVYLYTDGGNTLTCIGAITANAKREDVDNAYHVGAYHGFSGTLDAGGIWGTVGVNTPAINIGEGDNVWPEQKSVDIPPTGTPMTEGYERTIPDGDYLILNAGTTDKTTFCYLDIDGTAHPAEDGTNVAIYGPNTEPPSYEAWTLKYQDGFYTITQMGTSKALDVSGGSLDWGANVQVYEANSSDAQKWAISLNGRNGYKVQAKCSGCLLDVANGGTEPCTNVRQWNDNDSDAQSWLFVPYEPDQPVEEGKYVLLSGLDYKLELNVEGEEGEYNVGIWNDSVDSKGNAFEFIKRDNGYYKIKHIASGKVLEVHYGLSEYTSNVKLHTDNDSIAQQWAILKKGGHYVLIARCSGFALDIEEGKKTDGTNVIQFPYNGNTLQANQSWKIVPAEYIVSYKSDDGDSVLHTQTKNYKEEIVLSGLVPYKEGYSFTGWNTKADGTGVTYRPKATYSDDSDLVLYAQFKSDSKDSSSSSGKKSSSSSSGRKDSSSSSGRKSSSSSSGRKDNSSSSGRKSSSSSSGRKDNSSSSSDKDSGSSSDKDSSSSSEKKDSDAPGTKEDYEIVRTISMNVIRQRKGELMIVGDEAIVKIDGVDPKLLQTSSKNGIYKCVIDEATGETLGILTAIKKGSIKLYQLDGRKKRTVCTVKAEQSKLKSVLMLKTGKVKILKLKGTKKTADSWVSSNPEVANVTAGGVLVAAKSGTATVTAKLGVHTYECTLIVK